jgi:hypothetical protein
MELAGVTVPHAWFSFSLARSSLSCHAKRRTDRAPGGGTSWALTAHERDAILGVLDDPHRTVWRLRGSCCRACGDGAKGYDEEAAEGLTANTGRAGRIGLRGPRPVARFACAPPCVAANGSRVNIETDARSGVGENELGRRGFGAPSPAAPRGETCVRPFPRVALPTRSWLALGTVPG